MKKVIMVIVVLMMLVLTILNTSKNTSTTELLVSETKARNDIESIHGAIDIVGEGAFKGVDIDSKVFKGEISQPPSYAEDHLDIYEIKSAGGSGTALTVNYAQSTYEVKGDSGDTVKYADLAIPSATRKTMLTEGTDVNTPLNMGTLNDGQDTGISPIIKDKASVGWIKTFLKSETGMALDRLASNDPEFDDLANAMSTETEALKFMKVVFGSKPTAGNLKWNGHKSDRLVAMRHVDVKSLTGLGESESIQQMTNPNLVTLYQVANVNTVSLDKLEEPINQITGVSLSMAQINKLATHINQMLGGKLVLIPNQDGSLLIIDGIPTFVLN